MIRFIKIFTGIAFFASLASIICGFAIDAEYSQKLIGLGVVGLFFVVFPLFSYYRWKDKNLKDYMITNENLEKMRNREKKR
ncbi:hypothetical protein AB9K24_03570 [Meridianimaribacter flavus]|uniref:hypothetical protein n=1 Tax=Gaetbulibacter sp. NE TaxID=2982307 RepID=UPI0021CF9E46|nr:hypothetical protein [Gaetbulibacter sp. NE]